MRCGADAIDLLVVIHEDGVGSGSHRSLLGTSCSSRVPWTGTNRIALLTDGEPVCTFRGLGLDQRRELLGAAAGAAALCSASPLAGRGRGLRPRGDPRAGPSRRGVSELTSVAAAIQKQVARDLSQHWDVQGTISAFPRLEDVPPGYWSVIVKDDIEVDAAGTHCDPNDQPLALVTSGPGWSVTASHEAIEMLVDPFGNRTVAGPSPKEDQGRVEFLVEVADPIGDSTYSINGVLVSDYCTPHYYDPLQSSGVQFCYTGGITGPRQILQNGYLTWYDPVSNLWWQQSQFGDGQPTLVSLGPILKTACGLRAAVDPLAARRRRDQAAGAATGAAVGRARPVIAPEIVASSRAKAKMWRAHIRQLQEGRRRQAPLPPLPT